MITAEAWTAEEVSKLKALDTLLQQGPVQSGERRQQGLALAVDYICTHDKPVQIQTGKPAGGADSTFWMCCRSYPQRDGYGLLVQQGTGMQNITREARLAMLHGAVCR